MAKQITRVSNALAILAGCLLLLLIVLMAAEVVARYFLNAPIRGSFELLSTYILPMSIALALPYTFRTHGHVRIDILVSRLPSRVAILVGGCAWALTVLTAAGLAAMTLIATYNSWLANQTSAGSLRLEIWPVYGVATISLFWLTLEVLWSARGLWRGASMYTTSAEHDIVAT